MQPETLSSRIAQSASAIGAAILGFGTGIEFEIKLKGYGIGVIVIGALIHVYGMYLMQMKSVDKKSRAPKFLLITAWVCLVALVAIIIYLSMKNK